MTPKELQSVKEDEILKYGVENLYKSKKLSNVNMECYVKGFKKATYLVNYDFGKMIDEAIANYKQEREDIDTSAAYTYGLTGGYNKYQLERLNKIEKILSFLQETKEKLGDLEIKF